MACHTIVAKLLTIFWVFLLNALMKYRSAIFCTFCKNGRKHGYEHCNHPFLTSSELTCKAMKLQAAADSLAVLLQGTELKQFYDTLCTLQVTIQVFQEPLFQTCCPQPLTQVQVTILKFFTSQWRVIDSFRAWIICLESRWITLFCAHFSLFAVENPDNYWDREPYICLDILMP